MEQNCDDAEGREPTRRWKEDSPYSFSKLDEKKKMYFELTASNSKFNKCNYGFFTLIPWHNFASI